MWLVIWLIGCACKQDSVDPVDPVPTDTDEPPVVETDPPVVETGDSAVPVDTDEDVELTWVSVDIGAQFACGLVSDGTVRCWGVAACAQAEPPRSETFTQISVGIFEACGLRSDGTVACWGCDYPSSGEDIVPETPPGVFESVNVGHGAACARDAAGMLTCWGDDAFDTKRAPATPVLDYQIDSANACGVLEDGTLHCWGNGTQWGDDLPPVGVALTQVAVGRRHACGLDAAGTAYCWGDDTMLQPFPAPPPGVWAQIEAFDSATCAIDAAGTAECWWGGGLDNNFIGWPDPFAEPMAMIGLGEYEGCGVTLAGQADCWGLPDYMPSMQIPKLNP